MQDFIAIATSSALGGFNLFLRNKVLGEFYGRSSGFISPLASRYSAYAS